jgi:hypothetical protein
MKYTTNREDRRTQADAVRREVHPDLDTSRRRTRMVILFTAPALLLLFVGGLAFQRTRPETDVVPQVMPAVILRMEDPADGPVRILVKAEREDGQAFQGWVETEGDDRPLPAVGETVQVEYVLDEEGQAQVLGVLPPADASAPPAAP